MIRVKGGGLIADRPLADAVKDLRGAQEELASLERKEWWNWGSTLLVIAVLTVGVAVVCISSVEENILSKSQHDLALMGLVPLIVLFAIHSVRQHVMINRRRSRLALEMAMTATMEALRAPNHEQRKGWQNRRQSTRYYFDQRVKVHFGKETFHGRTRDISLTGIGVVIPDAVPTGSRVVLEFATGANEGTILVEGILRHHRGFYNGLEFVDVSREAMDRISQHCNGVTVPDGREVK